MEKVDRSEKLIKVYVMVKKWINRFAAALDDVNSNTVEFETAVINNPTLSIAVIYRLKQKVSPKKQANLIFMLQNI